MSFLTVTEAREALPDPDLVAKGELAKTIHGALAKYEAATHMRVTELSIVEMNVSTTEDVTLQVHRHVMVLAKRQENFLPWPESDE